METSSATTRERHPYRGYWPVRSNREILESPVFRGQSVRSPEPYHVRPPERVYDELTVNDSDVDTLPIDTAINEGWARVSEPLKYTNALVSRTMDGVQRYIANADDRPADDIERADPALAGVAAQAFVEGKADQAYIYTTNILAGEGAESVFTSEGYGDSVTYVNGFRFIKDLLK